MTHGGDIYSHEVELDFSANINPLGMPASVRTALVSHIGEFEVYPDADCRKLRRALAERDGVNPENIVCGNGASDLIYRLAGVLSPKRALVTAPAFSEYEKALTEAGAKVERYNLSEGNGFRIDMGITERIPAGGAVFLASPNNPDGGLIASDVLAAVIDRCRELGTALVLDECFADFAPPRSKRPRPPLSLRAFTKIYAMAGLRLGYLICEDAELAEKLASFGPCWSVSAPAQAAGLAAAGEKDYIDGTRRLIERERSFLYSSLSALGLRVFPSEANFLLFKGPTGLDGALLKRRIALRCCTDYHGLGPEFYRAAVRTRAENRQLVHAIDEIMREGL